MAQNVPRAQLFQEVWTVPIGQLATKYGLSRTDMVRLCDRHLIPRPPRGHWTRKRYRIEDPPPVLPGVEEPELEMVCLKKSPARPSALDPAIRHATDDEVNRLIQEELRAPAVQVPAQLGRQHRLVRALLDRVRQRGGFGPAGGRSATLTEHTWRRALRVMDALLKGLEARGHTAEELVYTGALEAQVGLLGETFKVRLHEPTRMEPHVLTQEERERKARYGSAFIDRHDYVPTGDLSLQLRRGEFSLPSFELRDRTNVKVEDRLNRFIIAALKEVDHLRQIKAKQVREAAARRESAEARKREELKQKELTALREYQAKELQAITDQIERWRRARDIRMYVEEFRTLVGARGDKIEPRSQRDKWTEWALSMADRIDPLATLRASRGPAEVEVGSRQDGS